MKTMKKIFGGILTVAIMLNSVATLSFADSEIAISAEKANPGYPVSVTVNGTPLTDDTDNNVEWYVCDSIDGTYAKIEGAVGTNWQITNACANKFIKAGIESGLKCRILHLLVL